MVCRVNIKTAALFFQDECEDTCALTNYRQYLLFCHHDLMVLFSVGVSGLYKNV